jgi:hypothetical protein
MYTSYNHWVSDFELRLFIPFHRILSVFCEMRLHLRVICILLYIISKCDELLLFEHSFFLFIFSSGLKRNDNAWQAYSEAPSGRRMSCEQQLKRPREGCCQRERFALILLSYSICFLLYCLFFLLAGFLLLSFHRRLHLMELKAIVVKHTPPFSAYSKICHLDPRFLLTRGSGPKPSRQPVPSASVLLSRLRMSHTSYPLPQSAVLKSNCARR